MNDKRHPADSQRRTTTRVRNSHRRWIRGRFGRTSPRDESGLVDFRRTLRSADAATRRRADRSRQEPEPPPLS